VKNIIVSFWQTKMSCENTRKCSVPMMNDVSCEDTKKIHRFSKEKKKDVLCERTQDYRLFLACSMVVAYLKELSRY
jgi:hypothetical protein